MKALKTQAHVVSDQKVVMKAHELINKRTAAKLDITKLTAHTRKNVLHTNKDGVILLDENNRDHMRWLKD